MTLEPSLLDLAIRLVLTLAAGMLIGYDRAERGHEAGLRTTTLLCLAASVSMIQMNLLLPVLGKQSDSFSVMDVMRLPLGILSGMGFIGAGAIMRRGDRIAGVTTAATMWAVTVIGLCFGGGQIWLGVVATALVWIILFVVKRLDQNMVREQKATLTVRGASGASMEDALRRSLSQFSMDMQFEGARWDEAQETFELCCQLRWKSSVNAQGPSEIIQKLRELPDVACVEWKRVS